MNKKISVGGQALIEGIMMKGADKTAMAVRTPSGDIDITYLEEKHLRDKYSFFGIPVIRGVVNFIETLIIGYKALMLSADKSGYTDLEEEKGKEPQKLSQKALGFLMLVASVLGVGLAIVLFMLLPRLAVGGLQWVFGRDFSAVVRSGIEQFIKLAVFVLYVWGVSFMKDIQRVFMYHGAEHKTIFCYENSLPLTIENIKTQKRLHPRCGTSFLILMILVSLVLSTVVQLIFPSVYSLAWLWVIIKILLVPLCCGFGYEILKFSGKHDNWFTRIISAPGMWLQRITTREPDEDMMEVAAAAVLAVLPKENEKTGD